MKNKWINGAFVLVLLLGLLAGLAKTLFLPKDINYYENRYAAKAAPLTPDAVLSGSFQDAMEEALADQIPAAQRLKKLSHLCFSTYQRTMLSRLTPAMEDEYLNIGGMRIFNGYLCYWFRPLTREQPALDRKIENYTRAFAAHPETEFYVFYVEKDTDRNLETGESNGVADYLRAQLPLPAERFCVFRLPDFATLREEYYRTDHHWNYRGSYRGYQEILEMLLPGEAPLEPLETVRLGRFSGSKASGRERAAFSEDFYAYRFAYPEMETLVNGASMDYGHQAQFLAGEPVGTLNYGGFYGGDEGYVQFRVPANAGKGELLVIGESFDNAVLKLLASHFETCDAVDLRYYETFMGHKFSLGTYLSEHPTAKVLLIGNLDYYVMDEFFLEG